MNSPLQLKCIVEALARDPSEAVKRFIHLYGEPARERVKRPSLSTKDMFRVFWRDGFIDRYTGAPVVNPAALRLLSRRLGEGDETRGPFPWHKNGRMDVCHFGLWAWSPAIDHVHPHARGGLDGLDNYVTTSFLTNGAKGAAMPGELGWEKLHPRGNLNEWDGLTRWFVEQAKADPVLRADPYFGRWFRAAAAVAGEQKPPAGLG
jgi:hypothetical protein